MMAESLYKDGVGKLGRVLFSGKKEDFAYFQERFEPRMFCLTLLDVRERSELEQKLGEGTNQEGRKKKRRKPRKR